MTYADLVRAIDDAVADCPPARVAAVADALVVLPFSFLQADPLVDEQEHVWLAQLRSFLGQGPSRLAEDLVDEIVATEGWDGEGSAITHFLDVPSHRADVGSANRAALRSLTVDVHAILDFYLGMADAWTEVAKVFAAAGK